MARKLRLAAIVNPQSANGRTREVWPELEAAIRDRMGEVASFECARRGHGTELTREALKEGYDRIVSVGGDGTHNEVVNGFFEGGKRINPKASMAIIPQGTASDFARTLEVTDAETAVSLLDSSEVTLADVGHVEYVDANGAAAERYFLNVAHFGLGGTVAGTADEGSKAMGGGMPYFIASLKTFVRFEAPLMRLRLDDEEYEGEYIDVILANGRYFGGGIDISRDVRLDNGFFEVFVVENVGRGQAIASLTRLYGGTVGDIDHVRQFRAKRVWAESDETVHINLDGEPVGSLPAFAAVATGALRLVTGRLGKAGPPAK